MTVLDEFRNTYRGDVIGKEVIVLESTVSTNDMAREICRTSESPEGIVVVADEQTGGRGRFGRRWISPPGMNLYCSVILRPGTGAGDMQLSALAAAAAVASAIREEAGILAEIKWPNDVLVNGRKVCGILAEMRSAGSDPGPVIVGIGVNVNMDPDAFGDDLRGHASSLKIEKGCMLDRGSLLTAILSRLEGLYKILLNGDKAAVIHEWNRLNCTLGRRVSVLEQERIITGTAENINERGELLVRIAPGVIETVSAGDVTILEGFKGSRNQGSK